jgi:hypothetical protein
MVTMCTVGLICAVYSGLSLSLSIEKDERLSSVQPHPIYAAKAASLSLQFTTELGALQGLLVGTFGY